MIEKLKNYAVLMRLNKPIGISLLLWPTLWALWLATEGNPSLKVLSIFMAGVVLMRSAGCIINDFADRHVDGQVARTKTRPLVTGKVSSCEALILFALLCVVAFILVLFLNKLTIQLAFVGAALAVFYPFMKRFTSLPQLGLGAAFSWGIPMAFAAEQQAVPMNAWLLFATALIWPVIYDTWYAMTDREDDIAAGIKSTAILFGRNDRLVVGILQILFLFLLCVVGFVFHLSLFYFISLVVVFFLFGYQQVMVRTGNPQMCFQAFLNNHWVGFFIFAGIFVSYI